MSDEPSISIHPTEDLIELYCLGRLKPDELEQVEVHLLLCAECQETVEETDAFIAATRKAAARLPKTGDSRSVNWKGLFVLPLRPAGVVVAALIVMVATLTWTRDQTPQMVDLAALRGSSAVSATVRSGTPVRLNLDVTELTPGTPLTVELVDNLGKVRWEHKDLFPDRSRLVADVPKALNPGQYFVRLYTNAFKNELLREYSLRVQ